MKKKIIIAATLTALFLAACASDPGKTAVISGPIEYSVLSRAEQGPEPAGFQPVAAESAEGDYNVNVATTANRVLNEETHMLKVAKAEPVGEGDFSAWQLLCDEGGDDYQQQALNPLSYMIGGISSSLLTHAEQSIKIMGLDVDDVKVEVKVTFRYDDPMTPAWTGFTDSVVANILIESDEPADKIAEVKEMAVQAWAIGECLANPTPVDAQYQYNGEIWKIEYAKPGLVVDNKSYDNGLQLTSNEGEQDPVSFELVPDVGMDLSVNPFVFDVVGLAESAHDTQRPYLHKMTVRSLNNGYAAWEIYADDSVGYDGFDKAPTSNDYFSVGTTLCLMSQLTGSQMIHQKQGINITDFRAEHQFDFQIDGYLTSEATGHVDGVTTRILVKGDATEEQMSDFATMALRMCFAGEAVTGETEMEIGIYNNGKIVEPLSKLPSRSYFSHVGS